MSSIVKKSIGIFSAMTVIIVIVLIVVSIYFAITYLPISVAGVSMEPNFKNGETWIAKRENKFTKGSPTLYESNFGLTIGRVIAVEGEMIKISNCKVYINNVQLEESYLKKDTCTSSGEFMKVDIEYVVPERSVFILGDNRDESYDSRFGGWVSIDSIKGTPLFNIKLSNKE